ncbi:hypothetical protein GCM10023328_25910 [Modestobacter marinus]|uniref:Uncharacterized protein n=1 Tax=Modestobacter marinus TaxID=477641 RepID=A0ABQ2FWL0_9ACTN|nr:hypothetical protein GCM10011589_16970 [Modestobacter marinus]
MVPPSGSAPRVVEHGSRSVWLASASQTTQRLTVAGPRRVRTGFLAHCRDVPETLPGCRRPGLGQHRPDRDR